MTTNELWEDAHKDITYIFQELLPGYGLTHRPEQEKLSHFMLDAMIHSRIALCDAGTGIGKTFAYLVAGTVFDHCRRKDKLPRQPMIISTSSIALQNAVKYEYLPLLSAALLDAGIIEAPVLAVIRKGKSHYVCDKRLDQRLAQVSRSKKNQRSLEALENLQSQLDLDEAVHLSDYDRRIIVTAAASTVAIGSISSSVRPSSICFRCAITICCLQTPFIGIPESIPFSRSPAHWCWTRAIRCRKWHGRCLA